MFQYQRLTLQTLNVCSDLGLVHIEVESNSPVHLFRIASILFPNMTQLTRTIYFSFILVFLVLQLIVVSVRPTIHKTKTLHLPS